MKKYLLLISLLFLGSTNVILAALPNFIKTDNGVIIYTDSIYTGYSNTVKLEVVTDNIIKVTVTPGKELISVNSLITILEKEKGIFWELIDEKDSLILKTHNITAVIDSKTGNVLFRNKEGAKILNEKPINGRSFQSTVLEGKPFYRLTQHFQTSTDDAWYGLGQHQDGIMNYKGQQVTFFQNNTEVAIPFLVSNKKYGILWDNYSLTKVGDIRPYQPLSSFQLYSKLGEPGWLTASYYNNKDSNNIVTERAETDIKMEYLGESRIMLPQNFNGATGKVIWEGSIADASPGLHQLKFIFGGTLKVWLNNKLVLDRWRKSWNPAPALIPVDLKADEKFPIRIEWIPEGGDSYLAVKWQQPLSEEERNNFGFCSEAGKQINYYFIYGENIDSVISGYRMLTGKAPIVPKWALGFWQSRERYKTQDEVINTVSEFRKRKIPIDNIVLDWNYWKEQEWGSQDFDKTRFPSPETMINVLHKKYNAQIMISVWPKFYEGIATYNEFDKKGWLYKKNIADRQRDWIGQGYVSTFYDAFNADARKGFWDLINKKIFVKGIDAWWMDASEPDILSNVSPEKRIQQMTPTAIGTGSEYLNAYPLQNAKGIYEGQRSADTNKRVFLLTRSGFAGSQRFGAAIWSGDIGSTWHDMKMQIAAGINFSMSGLPYWTMDIGGFVVPEKFEKPNEKDLEEWRELMTRWTQFGAFVPLFRVHGQYPFREIYNVAPQDHPAYKSFLYYDKLRYRLLPYTYSLAGAAYHANYTIMRGLAMDFGSDTAVLNIPDQYMFGPSLLINPVYGNKQLVREMYLPKSNGWYDLYSGKWFAGGQRINAAAPYEKIPVFVKAGSIIPFGPALQYTAEKPADTITLNIYTGADASFNLYEDEGINYNYEKGRFSTIHIKYTEANKTLTIEDRKGDFSGMLQQRVFNIVWIAKDKPIGIDANINTGKKIIFKGNKVTIINH
jgi:alpha-D-xyloside xylohydrolase